MILPVHAAIRAALTHVLQSTLELPAAEHPAIVLEVPPRRALGDLAAPLAFELARRLRQAPRVIAQRMAGALGPISGVARVEATANGYLNLYLDRAPTLQAWLASPTPAVPDVRLDGGKVIVEHTAINPNKAAHIGHLRNAALGDTLVR